MQPENFKPEKPGDLIGMAKKIAAIQIAKAKSGKMTRLCLLLWGKPGCGKSSVCDIIAKEVSSKLNITHISACAITADTVRDWIQDNFYTRMNNEWRVYWIEECDAINSTVEVLMLQLLDKMPDKTAVLCTTNLDGKLTDRFQSRFQSIHVQRPKAAEISKLLIHRWPELNESAFQISETCGGDVRQALNDAQAHLDFIEYERELC